MKPTRYTDLDLAIDEYTLWYVENQNRVTTLASCVRFLRLAIDGRLYLLHLLRNRVAALRNSHTNTSDLDGALETFTQWYAANHDTITDVLPLLTFLKKATDDSLHLLHLMREQVATLQVQANSDRLILLPTGYRI